MVALRATGRESRVQKVWRKKAREVVLQGEAKPESPPAGVQEIATAA
jgi:hypothetical protein